MTALVWFRNDLRCHDHPALSAAAHTGPCRAVYLLCPQQLDEHLIAPVRRHYLRRALDALGTQLAALGIPFDIVNVGHFRNVPEALVTYCAQHHISRIFAHEELLLDEQRRDAACSRALSIPLNLLDDSLLHPQRVLKDNGTPYKVFTPLRPTGTQPAANRASQLPAPPPICRANTRFGRLPDFW